MRFETADHLNLNYLIRFRTMFFNETLNFTYISLMFCGGWGSIELPLKRCYQQYTIEI